MSDETRSEVVHDGAIRITVIHVSERIKKEIRRSLRLGKAAAYGDPDPEDEDTVTGPLPAPTA